MVYPDKEPPMPTNDTDSDRQEALKRLVGRTIVKAEGSGWYDAPITLTFDNGEVVTIYATGDDAARVNLSSEDD